MKANAFEALCARAGTEKWCWDIGCTTCGHLHFRFAFRDLSTGLHPDSPAWRVHRAETNGYGDLPRRFTVEEQERLVEIFAHASVAAIAASTPFPDWLGYLGLALLYTEEDEQKNARLTHSWVPQLLSLLPENSPARDGLGEAERLTWRHLECVEGAIRYR
jgi:hypothetical protein